MTRDMVIGLLIGALVIIVLMIVLGLTLPDPDVHVGPVASSWSATPTP